MAETAVSPALDFSKASGKSHVVMMVDLDAPGGASDDSYSPLLHWLTPVDSGEDSFPRNASLADAFAPYVGPAPPVGTGAHRYVVLLFTNPNDNFDIPSSFKDLDMSNITNRFVFDIQKFTDEGNFNLVAANWFTTENRTTVVPVGSATKHSGSNSAGFLGLVLLCGLMGAVL